MRIATDYLGIHVCVVRTCKALADPKLPCKLPEIEIRKIEHSELVKASEDLSIDLESDFIAEALDRGDIGFGAFDDGVLVAYTWRTRTFAPHTDKVWIKVERPYSYCYKSFTRPAYRGQRLLPSLILHSDAEMLKLGFTHRAGFVAVTNFASLEVGKHMGAEAIGHAAFVLLFGRCLSIRSKAVKKIGFEFFVRE